MTIVSILSHYCRDLVIKTAFFAVVLVTKFGVRVQKNLIIFKMSISITLSLHESSLFVVIFIFRRAMYTATVAE